MNHRTPDEQCAKILATHKSIPLDGSISILTGGNGTGKSLIRSQLNFRTKEFKKNVVHASMALRTGSFPHMGALSGMTRDLDWLATSASTFHCIQKAIKSLNKGYLCLDEIEIGCSIETVMGMVQWLNKNLPKGIENSLGCLVITHSSFVVRNLNYDHWFNLDDYDTAEAWLNREIIPTDMEEFDERHTELFKCIQGRISKK